MLVQGWRKNMQNHSKDKCAQRRCREVWCFSRNRSYKVSRARLLTVGYLLKCRRQLLHPLWCGKLTRSVSKKLDHWDTGVFLASSITCSLCDNAGICFPPSSLTWSVTSLFGQKIDNRLQTVRAILWIRWLTYSPAGCTSCWQTKNSDVAV